MSKDGDVALNVVYTYSVESSRQVRLVCIVVSKQGEAVGALDGDVNRGRVDLRELDEVALGGGEGEEGGESKQEADRLHVDETVQ